MSWVRVDDGMHAHRKTRRVLASGGKRRDVAPMGLWLMAASWSAQNGTTGWVPECELDRWDDDWQEMADRLVDAGYWWPEEMEGEKGFGIVNWGDYNDHGGGASRAGAFGNHTRWHVRRGVVNPTCPHCPREPIAPDEPEPSGRFAPDIAPDSPPTSPPESGSESQIIAQPSPTPPQPKEHSLTDVIDETSSPDGDGATFDDFWGAWPRKVDKANARKAWRTACRKVDPSVIVAASAAFAAECRSKRTEPRFIPHASTWLNGERWSDSLAAENVKPDPIAAGMWEGAW